MAFIGEAVLEWKGLKVMLMYMVPRYIYNVIHTSFLDLSFAVCYFPLNDFIEISPIQMHWRPNLTLSLNRSRSTNGHHSHKFVDFKSQMFHAKL